MSIIKKKRKSFLRIIFGILLALPIGYLLLKSNLPGQNYSKFDHILKYFIPVFIALAYIIDTWETSGKNTSPNFVKSILIIIAALIFGVVMGQGEKLNENDFLGTIVIGSSLFSISSIFFYCASFQYRKELFKDQKLKVAYYFSVGSLLLSLFQIPVWVLITGQFPPRGFTDVQALIVTIIVLIALFGPAAPWLLIFQRHLAEMIELRKDRKKKR